MRALLLIISLFASVTLFAQGKIVPVFGLEGGGVFGGLSEQTGYQNSAGFNGSFWIDFMGISKKGKPTVGVKFKFGFNPYVMKYTESYVNPPPDITIQEMTVSALFKFCLASKTNYYTVKEGDEKKEYMNAKGLFLLAGPQIGFVSITGGESNYAKNNYSLNLGAEYHINRAYFFIWRQIGFTEIYPSKSSVRLTGVSVGIGFSLF
jgi:hypothetical protein